jgi:hypothetical protein
MRANKFVFGPDRLVNHKNGSAPIAGSPLLSRRRNLIYIVSCMAQALEDRVSGVSSLLIHAKVKLHAVFPIAMVAVTAALLSSPARALSYYVDGRVAQSGTGTDWSRAWKSFDAIKWSQIKAGDTVFISGGTTGVTYDKPLTVRASGLSGKRVRIARAATPGRNGRVLITGRGILSSCVIVDGFSHVSIENLTVVNCTEDGFRIRNAKDVVVSGSSIFALSRGFHIWRTSEVTILANNIATPTWSSRQNDGIYSQENSKNSYVANNIVISNGYLDGHDDGIQSYRDRDILVFRNYVEQRNRKTGNALGIFFTDSHGTMTVVNNIVVGVYTRNSLVSMLNISRTGGSLKAYNNTLIGSKWGIVQIENAPASVIMNNILYSNTADAAGITIAGDFPQPAAINYNVYYLPNGRPGYHVTGTSYQWSNWRALGYEGHGAVSAQPPVDASFSLPVGSVAIDAGISATRIDQAGRGRPQGRSFDIGALERR